MPHHARIGLRFAAAVLAAVGTACHLDDLTSRPASKTLIQVSASGVQDSAMVGETAPHVVPVVVAAAGGGAFDWSAHLVAPATWISVSPTGGHAADGQDTLQVMLVPQGLVPGAYDDTLVLAAAGDTSAVRMPVHLVVSDCVESPLTLGTALSDSLTASDCRPATRAGRVAQVYALPAPAPESLSVFVVANGFAPYVVVTQSNGPVLREGACPAAPAACLSYVATGGAALEVMVTSASPGQTGTFQLTARGPALPNGATALRQLRGDGATPISEGATIADTALVFAATGTDADPGDSVRLEVEIRASSAAFSGVPTQAGAEMPQGPETARVVGLPDGAYHWQARLRDQTGRAGPWVPFSTASGPDFTLSTPAAPATALAFSAQPTDNTAGRTWSPVVAVAARNASGGVDTSYTGAISLALAGSTGASLGGTVTQAATRGVATFPDLHLDRAGSGYQITATAGSLTKATSNAFAIVAASAARLTVAVQPGTAAVGAALQPAPAIRVEDAFGNLVAASSASVTVVLTGGTAGATLGGTTTVAAGGGIATFSTLTVDRAGTAYHLDASATGLSSAETNSFDITAVPGATNLAFTTSPTNNTAGHTWSGAVTVAARKADGTVDTTFTSGITVALNNATNGATLGGTLTQSAIRGIATFADLHVDIAGNGYSLSASTSGLTSATSATFNITADAASRLTIVQQPTSMTAGAAITPAPSARIEDSFGNLVTTSTASVTVGLSGGTSGATLSGTRTVVASGGIAAFSTLSVDKSGTGYTLAFSSTGLSGAQSTGFTVSAGAAAALHITVQPGGSRAGQTITPPIQVTVVDAFGNAVTGYTTAVHVAIGQDPNLGLSSLSGTVTVTPASGVATFFDLSINLAGSGFTLKFSSGSLPSVESASFNVSL